MRHRWFHSRGRWVAYGGGCWRCDAEREAWLNRPAARELHQKVFNTLWELQMMAAGVRRPPPAPPIPPWPYWVGLVDK